MKSCFDDENIYIGLTSIQKQDLMPLFDKATTAYHTEGVVGRGSVFAQVRQEGLTARFFPAKQAHELAACIARLVKEISP